MPASSANSRRCWRRCGFEVLLQSSLGIDGAEETGATFEANALLKARHAARVAGLPALADDSGLEVDALGGRPGVLFGALCRRRGRATRPTTPGCCASSCGVPPDAARGARYRCVIAFVRGADDPAAAARARRLGRAHRAAAARQRRLRLRPAVHPGGTAPSRRPSWRRRTRTGVSHRGQALRALVAQLGRRPDAMSADARRRCRCTCTFPWCVRKCPYCDFNSHALRGGLPEQPTSRRCCATCDARPPRRGRPRDRQRVPRRRHAQPVPARTRSARLLGHARAGAALRRGRRGHAGGESRHDRARPLRRISRRRHQPRVAGRAELRADDAASDWAASTPRTTRAVPPRSCTPAGLDEFQSRPDVRAAGAGPGAARWPTSHAALQLAPAHLSHYQLTLEPGTLFGARPPAGLPDDDAAADDAAATARRSSRRGLRAVRGLGLCARGPALRAQPELLGVRRLPRHRRRRARQAHRRRRATASSARRACASRGATWRAVPAGSRASKAVSADGSALRIHDECAAPESKASQPTLFESRTGLPWSAVSATLEQALEGSDWWLSRRRSLAHDPAGRALPQRAAAAFPALSRTRPGLMPCRKSPIGPCS